MESSFSRFVFDRKDLEKVLEWANYLLSNKECVVELLRDEKVLIEEAYYEVLDNEIYVYYFWIAANIQNAGKISEQSDNSVNIYHRAFIKKYRKRSVKFNKLFSFINEEY